MVAVIVSVVGAVGVEDHFPFAGAREADAVIVPRLVAEVHHHHHVVSRAPVLEAVEADQLVAVVDVEKVDVGPGQAAAVAIEVSSEGDEITVQIKHSAVGVFFGPIQRVRVAEVLIFQELLPLENHGHAWSRHDQGSAKRGAFPGVIAARVAWPDGFWDP